jgi:hypothetical protein
MPLHNVRPLPKARSTHRRQSRADAPRRREGATLGSVDDPPSVRGRFAFWAGLPERLARLGNRLGASEQPKIYEGIHARIPMATPEDQRTIQEENAKDDEGF